MSKRNDYEEETDTNRMIMLREIVYRNKLFLSCVWPSECECVCVLVTLGGVTESNGSKVGQHVVLDRWKLEWTIERESFVRL